MSWLSEALKGPKESSSSKAARKAGKSLDVFLREEGTTALGDLFSNIEDIPQFRPYAPDIPFLQYLSKNLPENVQSGLRPFLHGESEFVPTDFSADFLETNPALQAFKANISKSQSDEAKRLVENMANRGILDSGTTRNFATRLQGGADRALATETGRIYERMLGLRQSDAARRQQAQESFLSRMLGIGASDLSRRDAFFREEAGTDLQNFQTKQNALVQALNSLTSLKSGFSGSANQANQARAAQGNVLSSNLGALAGWASSPSAEGSQGSTQGTDMLIKLVMSLI